MLDWLGFTLALGALFIASIYDLKERLIPDWIWLLSYPPAAALLILQIIYEGLQPLHAAVSLIIAAGISSAFYFLGLMGAADLFAMLLIGVAVPKYPYGLPFRPDPLGTPVFTAACNAALLSAFLPVATLLRNLVSILRGRDPLSSIHVGGRFRRILLLMTTRKISVDELKRGLFYFPAERLVEGRRVPIIFARAEWDFSALLSEIESNRSLYVDGVLASPTVPMILCITVGLSSIIIGNIIFTFMLSILIC